MKHRISAVFILIAVTLLAAGLSPVAATRSEAPSLVQIWWQTSADLDRVRASGVPVYAHLANAEGPYVLAGAGPGARAELQAQGLAFSVLDADASGASYYVVYPMPGRPRPDWAAYGRILLAEDDQIVLRTSPGEAEKLAELGVELQAISLDPKPLGPSGTGTHIPADIDPDPMIQGMLDQVDGGIVFDYVKDLTGEQPAEIGGSPYTIATRHTTSGTPIQKATQYAYEHLANLGLDMEYHNWTNFGYSGRNVIGELPGETNPDDIYIICAHVDDMPSGALAPGADDNASGSVAVLVAADLLTQHHWGCTLRFALWTGEEQGLLGSEKYAQRSYAQGENIVGVLNLDMIAWDAEDGPDIDLHARSSLPQTLALGYLFADVVDAYSLDLSPEVIYNGIGASDHASFWQYGYTAILGIEDWDDFNDYYHTTGDTMVHFNKNYFLDFVRASVGTFAHMSDCLIRPRFYYVPLVIKSSESAW
jgi:hypothetical protein